MTATDIDRIRSFNRFYTARLGLLARHYLGTGRSLTELRVLIEIAGDAGISARDLARRLDLDEGYLSRVIAGFLRDGWVARHPVPGDKRRYNLTLTVAGQAVAEDLVARARADLTARLADIPPPALAAAAEALSRAERLLTPPDPDAVTFRDIAVGDAGWLIQRHGELYARDEGFDASFEPLVAEILTAFLRAHDPATERAFIATRGPDRLGSIFCVQSGEPGVAKLRLFFLEPEARGLGLGQRLLDACLGFARGAGYRRMVLWTHESHRAACALYAKNGFEMTMRKPVRSFGVDLVEQSWQIAP